MKSDYMSGSIKHFYTYCYLLSNVIFPLSIHEYLLVAVTMQNNNEGSMWVISYKRMTRYMVAFPYHLVLPNPVTYQKWPLLRSKTSFYDFPVFLPCCQRFLTKLCKHRQVFLSSVLSNSWKKGLAVSSELQIRGSKGYLSIDFVKISTEL